MIEFIKVENINGEFKTIRTRLEECQHNVREITETVRNRIITDQKNAKRRAEELKMEIESADCSDIVRRIKQNEIDAIACRRYEPTDSEKAEFNQAITEYKAALTELKSTQSKLLDAVAEARNCLGILRQNAYKGADPVLLDRDVSSAVDKFDKLFNLGVSKQ